MRYITEQELQQKYRAGKLEKLALTKEERLTPGANQFLSDHQIPIEKSDLLSINDDGPCEKLLELAAISKQATFFSLLEIELWEAALSMRDIRSASCKRIADLASSVKHIQSASFAELTFDLKESPEAPSFAEIDEACIFQPGAEVLLQLRRAATYATALQSCVSAEQKKALCQLIFLMKQELDQLEEL